MSLQDKTILITRQREQSAELIAALEKRGGRAVLLPMINIQDPESWEGCDHALQQIKTYDAILFTSTNGVDRFLHRCLLKSVEPVILRRCEMYAVGEKTKQAIEKHGFGVKAVPDQYSSVGLAEFFLGVNINGKRFLYPRGDIGSAELIKNLVHQGASVDPVIVYRNTAPDEIEAEHVYRKLVAGEIDVITFASPSAAGNFTKLFPPERMATMHTRTTIAAIGPTTHDELRRLGMRVDIVAAKATVEGLLDAIEEHFHP